MKRLSRNDIETISEKFVKAYFETLSLSKKNAAPPATSKKIYLFFMIYLYDPIDNRAFREIFVFENAQWQVA